MTESKAGLGKAEGVNLGSSVDKLMKKARLPRFSGAQMREHLQTTLPKVKAERKILKNLDAIVHE